MIKTDILNAKYFREYDVFVLSFNLSEGKYKCIKIITKILNFFHPDNCVNNNYTPDKVYDIAYNRYGDNRNNIFISIIKENGDLNLFLGDLDDTMGALTDHNLKYKIYKIDDLKNINFIIKYLSTKPTYQSKKNIERTLESNKLYPYRFKTMDELLNDFDNEEKWEEHIAYDTETMEFFSGKDYPFHIKEGDKLKPLLYQLPNNDEYQRLNTTWDMLTHNENIPTYKSKGKIIRESKKNFTIFVYRCDNNDDCIDIQKEIFKCGVSWNGSKNNIREFPGYPELLFVDFSDNSLTHSYLDDYIVKRYVIEDDETYKTIFDASCKNDFLNTIRRRGLSPSYKPKGRVERTFESLFKFNDTYPYDKIIVKVDSIEDVHKIRNYIEENNIDIPVLDNVLSQAVRDYLIKHKSIFIEFYASWDNTIDFSWDELDSLDKYIPRNEYEKVFSADDLISGLINNIKKYGKSNIVPSYKPKGKIVRESVGYLDLKERTKYEFVCIYAKSSEEMARIQSQLFGIGCGWNKTGERNSLLYLDEKEIIYCVKSDNYIYTLDRGGITDRIERFKSNIEPHNLCPHLFKYNELNIFLNYIKHGIIQPTYKPKGKMVRENDNNVILESKLHKDYKYDYIIIAINSIDEYKSVKDIIDKYPNFSVLDQSDIQHRMEKEPFYFRFGIDDDSGKFGICGFSSLSNIDHISKKMGWYNKYEKIFNVNDLKSGIIDKIMNYGNSIMIPSYKPKGKIVRESTDSYKLDVFKRRFEYDGFVVMIDNDNELDIINEFLVKFKFDIVTKKMVSNIEKPYPLALLIYRYSDVVCFYPNAKNEDINNLSEYEKMLKPYFTIHDMNTIRNILLTGYIQPSYKPKGKIIRENMLTNLNEYLLLEKSSLTALGVPKDVMQPIQRDLAIESDAKWNRMNYKKDVVNTIDKNTEGLILQVGLSDITVFVFFTQNKEKIFFVDSYIMKDEMDWGGGYTKLDRETISRTEFIRRIDVKTLVYILDGRFSVRKQPHRKMIKKERDFVNFTEKFKKDFLNDFNAILKRIVGYNYKDAKGEILDKAKKVEKENKMIISGLDNPLEGPNSLTILDQFLMEFEDKYSDYFGERLDIQELSELFTREKVMTSFMLYIYSGKIITT